MIIMMDEFEPDYCSLLFTSPEYEMQHCFRNKGATDPRVMHGHHIALCFSSLAMGLRIYVSMKVYGKLNAL